MFRLLSFPLVLAACKENDSYCTRTAHCYLLVSSVQLESPTSSFLSSPVCALPAPTSPSHRPQQHENSNNHIVAVGWIASLLLIILFIRRPRIFRIICLFFLTPCFCSHPHLQCCHIKLAGNGLVLKWTKKGRCLLILLATTAMRR